jgi:hypothetical protein
MVVVLFWGLYAFALFKHGLQKEDGILIEIVKKKFASFS